MLRDLPSSRILGKSLLADRCTCCFRAVPAEELVAAKLRVPSFHQDFGPSFDGVTVKNNFADIKGRRSFGTR